MQRLGIYYHPFRQFTMKTILLVCLLLLGMAMVVTSQGRGGFNPLMMMALGGGKTLHPWARLFKAKDVVSSRFVKFSNVNISNTPIFLLKKCEKLALQKLLSFFFNKKYVC